jgi:diguanylate cyclase (GGDEF)-like protein
MKVIQPQAHRPSAGAAASYAYLGFGAAMALALVVLRDTGLATVPITVVGLTTAVAVVVGRYRNRPTVTFPWTMFALACVAFIVGAGLRQALEGQPVAPLADVFSLSGYAAMFIAFVALLRNRRADGAGPHELIDGVIVCVSAASAALVFLALPVVDAHGWSAFTVLLGAYPVIDVAVVFVAVLLYWTSANRVVAFWLLAVTMTAMLVGDIGYADLGTHGEVVGSPLLDLPFVVAFGCFGAAALHPSMTALSDIQPRPVQSWSRARLVVLIPALLLPPVVLIVSPRTAGANWVCGMTSAMIAMLLLLRAVGAVGEHSVSQQDLRYQATHDVLTGLANRARLVARVEAFIRRSERDDGRVDLLFLDLDKFKLINDTWGHQTGDEVLRTAADRLLSIVDSSDVVARLGGDEFVIARYVQPGQSRCGESLAADIIDSFRAPLSETDAALVATVSVGLVHSTHPATAEGLLRDADAAMYRAKASGRNRCVTFDASMHDAVRRRVETELALRHALDRDQFLLYYQPIVDLETREVLGVEALLRWAHPGMGMVAPLDFIPVAEETGLIVEIGEWVVTEAVRQLSLWRAEGHESLWVAVNVSARQLRDARLVDHVETELRRFGVPADRLVVEITESAMMDDERTSAALFNRLRAMGVPLAVDDFGTGYSSLGHLRRFPVSKVKIDREFIAGLDTDNDDAAIVRAVVAMSLAMGLEVVAEGIETEGQRALLLETGVQLGQGWLFARAEAPENCVLWAAQPAAEPARAKS